MRPSQEKAKNKIGCKRRMDSQLWQGVCPCDVVTSITPKEKESHGRYDFLIVSLQDPPEIKSRFGKAFALGHFPLLVGGDGDRGVLSQRPPTHFIASK
ncbi:hypothetical protein Tsubulata_030856 [Turnera subulata]|uniref:Uncharacterized protein n=1 Tax=Turnera subulata TaxID=218843 RepID=A0A9Q0JC67_9ROSI|nr:hypothetical protein Tsubulata_030856 [Turnera subulata]